MFAVGCVFITVMVLIMVRTMYRTCTKKSGKTNLCDNCDGISAQKTSLQPVVLAGEFGVFR